MVIPVAGIPIEITRIYDTLQADREGDFGYGWRLEYRNTDLRVGLPKSGLEDIGIYSALRPGVKVYLNVPGQGRQGFTFNPDIRVLPGFGGNNLVLARPRFTPDPGVTSTLSTGTSSYLQVNERGELYAPGGIPYNPASPDFGGAYVLTTREGITYRINGASGNLESAIDRNGNSLQFDEQGVASSRGERLLIERDIHGRILHVGKDTGIDTYYEYANGNLSTIRDIAGDSFSMGYDSQSPHYLSEIVDPRGEKIIEVVYDENGRFVDVFDANGNSSSARFDPTHSKSEVTDARGNKTIFEYGALGELLSQTDAMGNRREMEYDQNGSLTRTIAADGTTTQFKYDPVGNLVVLTDALGGKIHQRFENNLLVERTDRLGNSQRFSYDATGNLISSIDALGNETTRVVDPNGELARIEDANGNWTEFVRSTSGQVVMSSNAAGQVLTLERNARGQVSKSTLSFPGSNEILDTVFETLYNAKGLETQVTNPLGGQRKTEYDQAGNPIRTEDSFGNVTTSTFGATAELEALTNADGVATELERDKAGQTTLISFSDASGFRFEYDELGRQIAFWQFNTDGPESIVWTRTFDSRGHVLSQTDVGDRTTAYEYDPLGRRVAVIDALGNKTRYEFDAENRIKREVSPLGHVSEFSYDVSGRLVETVFSDGSRRLTIYDRGGRPIEVIDELGQKTQYSYDVSGNLLRVVEPNGLATRYEYAQGDRLVAIIDAKNRVTRFDYDAAGNRTRIQFPDGQTEEFEYDRESRLVRSKNEAGEETAYIRDRLGIVTEIVFHDGATQKFEYDDRGQLIAQEDSSGKTSYEYNARQELVSREDTNGNTVTYTYDVAGQVESVSTSDRVIVYGRDLLGRVVTMTDQDGLVTSYEYDEDGNHIGVQFPNGISETREYDVRNRLTRLVQSTNEGVLASYEYMRDAFGRISKVTELDGTQSIYTYDERFELLEEHTFAPDGSATTWKKYMYDEVGNRVQTTDLLSGKTETSHFDQRDRLTSRSDGNTRVDYAFDSSGRVVEESDSSGRKVTTSWNSYGRMDSVVVTEGGSTTEVGYIFDFEGNLISRNEGGSLSTMIYDTNRANARVLAELDQDGNVDRHFQFGVGLNVVSGPSEFYSVLSDGQGNVRAHMDQNGNRLNNLVYDAFGVLLLPQLTESLEMLYNQELRDTLVGVDFLRARSYDASTGRFTTRDPFEGVTGDSSLAESIHFRWKRSNKRG